MFSTKTYNVSLSSVTALLKAMQTQNQKLIEAYATVVRYRVDCVVHGRR